MLVPAPKPRQGLTEDMADNVLVGAGLSQLTGDLSCSTWGLFPPLLQL